MAQDSSAPVLGQAVGFYRERVPLEALRPHFTRVWFNHIAPGPSRTAAIVPDGCLDLQWFNGVLRVAGPDREAKVEVLPGGTTVIGLRFQAGSAVPWLGVPASEIINERVPLEAFWEREARDLTEWANEARTVDGIARRLEAALARRAATVRPPNAIARSMFRLVGASRQPGNWVIRNLRDRLELSERTLRRHCHEAFGYGPKTLDRILRFQRFLRLAQSSHPGGLAALAVDAGYSDQAHLSREMRRLAGVTPSAIVTQLTG